MALAPNGTPRPKAGSLASQESLLLEYVQRLDKHRKGRLAVHVHIAKLRPQNRRDQHVRMAAGTFEQLVKTIQGQLFQMSNNDLMLMFKKEDRDAVESAIVKLRFSFADDPLLGEVMEAGESAFETWYDIEHDYDRLVQSAEELLTEAHERLEAQKRQKQMDEGTFHRRRQEPLTPKTLGRIERALAQADLSNLVRRQSVSAIVGAAAPQPIYRELFCSIKDLRETLAPHVDLFANRWLFQHLTDTLDRRVLAMLSKHDDRTLDSDIAVNLNVSTLLSEDFLKFDDNVKAGLRGSIVFELQKVDIFADLSTFLFARDVVHEMGYRICIDGLNVQALDYVERARLGADMIKVFWEPEIARRMEDPTTAHELKEKIKRAGVNRTVLARIDDQDAIAIGQDLGLTLFQGYHVESLLFDEEKREARGKAVLLVSDKPKEEWR